mmetsp:Transcript_22875/g.73545  ORF Transcript_22875/g.73545 Transcript_22875/m.73545 type:complete len:248 (+) Transcript_22875:147-890(+)
MENTSPPVHQLVVVEAKASGFFSLSVFKSSSSSSSSSESAGRSSRPPSMRGRSSTASPQVAPLRLAADAGSRTPKAALALRSTRSTQRVESDSKGESATAQWTSRSRSAAERRAATAPMDLPQRATLSKPKRRRKAMATAVTSRDSRRPSVTKSPVDAPEPAQSKAQRAVPRAAQPRIDPTASARHELFPWTYSTQVLLFLFERGLFKEPRAAVVAVVVFFFGMVVAALRRRFFVFFSPESLWSDLL